MGTTLAGVRDWSEQCWEDAKAWKEYEGDTDKAKMNLIWEGVWWTELLEACRDSKWQCSSVFITAVEAGLGAKGKFAEMPHDGFLLYWVKKKKKKKVKDKWPWKKSRV